MTARPKANTGIAGLMSRPILHASEPSNRFQLGDGMRHTVISVVYLAGKLRRCFLRCQ
jgi:hypothetical protein